MANMTEASTLDGPLKNSIRLKGGCNLNKYGPFGYQPLTKFSVDATTYVRKKRIYKSEKNNGHFIDKGDDEPETMLNLGDTTHLKIDKSSGKRRQNITTQSVILCGEQSCQTMDKHNLKKNVPSVSASVKSQTSQERVDVCDKRPKVAFLNQRQQIPDSLLHVYDLLNNDGQCKVKQNADSNISRMLSMFTEDVEFAESIRNRNATNCKIPVDTDNTGATVSASVCTQYSKPETTTSLGSVSNQEVRVAPLILVSALLLKPQYVDKYTSCTSLPVKQHTQQTLVNLCEMNARSSMEVFKTLSSMSLPISSSQEVISQESTNNDTKRKIVKTLNFLRVLIDSHPCINQTITNNTTQVNVLQTNYANRGFDKDGNIPARYHSGCGMYKNIDRTKSYVIPCSKVKNCPQDCGKPTDPMTLANVQAPAPQEVPSSPKPSQTNVLNKAKPPKCRTCKWQKRMTVAEATRKLSKKNKKIKKATQEEPHCGILVNYEPDSDDSEKLSPNSADRQRRQNSKKSEETFNNLTITANSSSSDPSSEAVCSEPTVSDHGIHFHFNKITFAKRLDGKVLSTLDSKVLNKRGSHSFAMISKMSVKASQKNASRNTSKLPRWTDVGRTDSPILWKPEIFDATTSLRKISTKQFWEQIKPKPKRLPVLKRPTLKILQSSLKNNNSSLEIIKMNTNIAPIPTSDNKMQGSNLSQLGSKSQSKSRTLTTRRPLNSVNEMLEQAAQSKSVSKLRPLKSGIRIRRVLYTKPSRRPSRTGSPLTRIPVYNKSPSKSRAADVTIANCEIRGYDSLMDLTRTRCLLKSETPSRTTSCMNFGLSPAQAALLRIGLYHEGATVGVHVCPSTRSTYTQHNLSLTDLPSNDGALAEMDIQTSFDSTTCMLCAEKESLSDQAIKVEIGENKLDAPTEVEPAENGHKEAANKDVMIQ